MNIYVCIYICILSNIYICLDIHLFIQTYRNVQSLGNKLRLKLGKIRQRRINGGHLISFCEIKEQQRLFVSADFYCQNLNNQNKCSNGVL